MADFVEVVSWHTDQDETFTPNTSYGSSCSSTTTLINKFLPFFLSFITHTHPSAVVQYYDIDIPKEFAIRGNAAIMKCQIPSFVTDFVNVISWHTDQDETFTPGTNTGLCLHKYLLKYFSVSTFSLSHTSLILLRL